MGQKLDLTLRDHPVNEYLKRAFDSAAKVFPGDLSGFMMTNPNAYDGWIDGYRDGFYLSIFDKRYDKGRKMSDSFHKCHRGGERYDFRPALQFRFVGDLILHENLNNLELVVLRLRDSLD